MDSVVNDSKIQIEIDQDLIAIVPEYLGNRRLDCDLIERFLAEGDLVEIRSLGHRMKGSGGSYGFDEISEIGEVLELAALKSDTGGIRSAAERLKRYLEKVSVVYI